MAIPFELDALAYLGITRLQAAYADVVTRRAWDELNDLFLPDTPVHIDTVTAPVIEVVGPAALGEFIGGAVERFSFFEFVPLNTVVDVRSPTDATGRLYMVELRQDADGGAWSNAYGLYQDHYRFDRDRWRFAERHYQSLARTGPLLDKPGEILPFPPDRLP